MKKKRNLSIIVIGIIILLFVISKQAVPTSEVFSDVILNECTMGVNHSSVTTHDSPMLWKVLDAPSDAIVLFPDDLCMTVKYYSSEDWDVEHNTIAIVYDYGGLEPHKYITGGLNDAGIGGGHTWAPPDEGVEIPLQSHLLYDILSSSGTMDDIRGYLADGVGQGMYQESGCYGFVDKEDKAIMFEVDTSRDTFWEYDTLDPDRESQGLQGFVVRANDFHRQEDGTDDTSIVKRYWIGTENTLGIIAAGELNEQSAVQSDSSEVFRLVRQNDKPWPISNLNSFAALAIRGAATGEPPELATMWALLGNPSFSIAVPTWVSVSVIPEPIRTCDMYNAVTSLFKGAKSFIEKTIMAEWVQSAVFPAEAHLFDMVNNRILPHWRTLGGPPPVEEMTRIEHQMAQDAFSVVNYLATTGEHNLAPTIDFEASRRPNNKYSFNPFSADADGDVISYLWDFGDGSTSTEISPVHKFTSAGVFLVSVTVADDDGVTTTAWRYLTIEAE